MTMTLGAELERDRLALRAARLDRVVTELRAQARAYGERPAVPRPLRHSLADFQRELDHVRKRLAGPAGARRANGPMAVDGQRRFDRDAGSMDEAA